MRRSDSQLEEEKGNERIQRKAEASSDGLSINTNPALGDVMSTELVALLAGRDDDGGRKQGRAAGGDLGFSILAEKIWGERGRIWIRNRRRR